MARMQVSAERTVDAPADTVYRYIADMREHHPRFLPPAFSDFQVESGGVGEPEPGRVLTESDAGSSAVTTFTVAPEVGASRVQIHSAWDGAGGIGGVLERMFAPRLLRAILTDELGRLDAYAREHRPA